MRKRCDGEGTNMKPKLFIQSDEIVRVKTIGDRPPVKDIEPHLSTFSVKPSVSPRLIYLSRSLWRRTTVIQGVNCLKKYRVETKAR